MSVFFNIAYKRIIKKKQYSNAQIDQHNLLDKKCHTQILIIIYEDKSTNILDKIIISRTSSNN